LIEYDVNLERPGAVADGITFVGKAKARGADESTFRLLQSLRSAGFGDDSADRVLVPEPIVIIPDFQMWLQSKVPGIAATVLLGGPDGIALAGEIARAAHKLHQTDVVPCRRVHTLEDELAILRDRMQLVAEVKPEWSDRLEQLLAACDRLGATLPPPSPRGIHRDFYADHVMVDGNRLYLLDFDLYCRGDPAVDIGNFVGHLIEQSLRIYGVPSELAQAQEELERQFAALAGVTTVRAVQAYTTFTLVRHIYISTQFAQRRHTTQALLEHCESRLRTV
jgi:aminoglycoside phosphotransferase (APT) family kinase protein